MYGEFYFIYFLRFYLFIFRERGREGDRKGEKYQCVVASHVPPTGDLARNPGMCPDWESNWWPLGSQASAQSTEPHQPGLCGRILKTWQYWDKILLWQQDFPSQLYLCHLSFLGIRSKCQLILLFTLVFLFLL